MVIKMDKSDEFIKSGKKLISEYDGANLKEDEEQKPKLLNEEVLLSQKLVQIVMCLNQNNLCTISYRSIVYGLG